MKVLLYFEGIKVISKSGVGKAMSHQMKALDMAGVEYTTNPDDDFDILHINTVYANSANIIKKARKKGAKVIYHAHTTMEDFKNSFLLSNAAAPVLKKILVYLYSKSDAIITPTPYTKKLIKSYGISVPTFPISNGIDIDRFKADERKAKAFRDYFNLKPEDKVVVAAGLWIKRKGILDFVEVARKLPDVTFIWFGETPLYSIPAEIRNTVTKNHPDNVIFAGYMSGDVFEGAYTGANAFFFPSYEENEGIVVLEALASNQVTIVRDIPVYDPWLVDGVNCKKCTNNDEFANVIRDAVNGKYADLTIGGRQVAEQRALSAIGQSLKKVYEGVYNGTLTAPKKAENPDQKLNIALFTDTYDPDINGVAISVETLRQSLEKLGHNVYVIAPTENTKLMGIIHDGGVLRIPGVRLKYLYGYRLSQPYSRKAQKILSELKLDVVHIHTEYTMRAFASFIAKKLHIPIIYTYHTMYEDYTHYITRGHFEKTARKIVRWLSRVMGNTCAFLVAPTNKTKRALIEYGVNKPITVIPTGIDFSSFSSASFSKEEIENARDRYGLSDKFVVIFLGRLAKEKNIDFLLKAMKKISTIDENIVLLIAGYGPYEEELKALAEEYNVADKVIFAGKQNHEDVPLIYQCADVFASASESETQGITYIEALASGLPVLAKLDECIEDIVIDGQTGYIFKDEDEYIEKLLKIKNSSLEEKQQLSEQGKAVAEKYSVENFGKAICETYREAIAQNNKKLEGKE
ncbi:MAG: glycosyltransferase [Ruminococcaceae bacterium]|nr:glycosyltransferase [Oscillospiraceae bacterium]